MSIAGKWGDDVAESLSKRVARALFSASGGAASEGVFMKTVESRIGIEPEIHTLLSPGWRPLLFNLSEELERQAQMVADLEKHFEEANVEGEEEQGESQ